MSEVGGRGIGSILVGGRVLAALAEAGRPLMLREIAGGADLTSAQAHAYLVSFRKIGLVEQIEGGRYQLGAFALQLGLARMRSVDALRLATEAAPALALELRLMTTITVWGAFGATVVQVNEGGGALHVNLRAGTVYSLLHTATGRVFAAFLPEETRAAHLRSAPAFAELVEPAGVVTTPALLREVARTRARGYAVASGSPIPGVNAIAAPVYDHTRALKLAVTLIGPAPDVDIAADSAPLRRLVDFAAALSADLGYRLAAPVEA